MLLAAAAPLPQTTFTPVVRHVRHRPKLSLKITALPVAAAPRTPVAATTALSPTTRNTMLNRALTAPLPSPTSPPSSSSSEEEPSPSRRRRNHRRRRLSMSNHQPSTPSASFMPATSVRGRERGRGRVPKRVGFVEEVTVHVLPPVESEMDAAEREREVERIRAWVLEQEKNSPDGELGEEERKEWMRKLVELEMEDA